MLTSLKIENVAIIESAAIEFGYGLNVLTGETGAGKSIVIDSINAILGERTSREIIRTGAQSAKVYAVFEDVSESVRTVLDENGIDCEDGVLIVNRTLNREGKNVCRLNGAPVTVSMLREIGRELIDIHGQHDNQALLSPEKHCSFVDNFAGNAQLLAEYRKEYGELNEIRAKLKKLSETESSKAQRIDFLTYQIDELEKAEITVGERDELKARKALINNSQKVMESLNAAYEALRADGAALDMVSDAESEIANASQYMESLCEAAEKITDIRYELDDIAELVRDSMSEIDFDSTELEDIEERLDLLFKLSSKYGETEEQMLDYLSKAKEELDNIAFSEEKVKKLRLQENELLARVEAAAQKLTQSRKNAGKKLSEAICTELEFLDMPNVSFDVRCEDVGLTENGRDSIEFLISANIGEEPKPLVKIASGGELSRIMLAIKNVLAQTEGVDTMIFDEIDTGVSGRAAQKIALKLKSVSKGKQVICVTHLAQIAAQGDVHLYISKAVSDGKTFTQIKSLDSQERVNEIARIMGGMEITRLQLESAREMLGKAADS